MTKPSPQPPTPSASNFWKSGTAPKRRQTIFRNVTPEEPYTQLPNAMLRDTRLDLDERGALAAILSRPTHWDFSKEHFCKENRIGRDRCQRIIRALEELGYCKRHQDRTPEGMLGSAVYLFSVIPNIFAVNGKAVDGEPLAGNPSTVQPSTGFSTREIKEREKGQTEETPPSEEGPQERTTTAVQPAEVVQPRKPKGGKVDLLGEELPKRRRNTKVEFPDGPELVEQWLAYGVSIGMTEEDAKRSIVLCAKHYQSEGKRKPNWTPAVEAWLLKDRDTIRKRANGVGRFHRPSNEDLAAEVWGGR
jgi:hypothetical protein